MSEDMSRKQCPKCGRIGFSGPTYKWRHEADVWRYRSWEVLTYTCNTCGYGEDHPVLDAE